jgi:uncharacterized protein YjbI with pentapeptide repeats
VLLGAAIGLLLMLWLIWVRIEAGRRERTHERFAAAIEQLASDRPDGSPRLEARLAGVHALERLAVEVDAEYWPVMDVLTTYLRENASWRRASTTAGPAHSPSRPSADIQAVLAALGRRTPPASPGGQKRVLDLREVDVRGANLSGAMLEGVNLQSARLDQADATRAHLRGCNLREASLAGATLTQADLQGVSLGRADLQGARLNGANLKGADLSGANLQGADLWSADLTGCTLKDADLRGADLTDAILDEAILWRADLKAARMAGVRLRDTHLERANLTGAVGLTWEQGEDAYTDENTLLPAYLLAAPPAPPEPTPNVVQIESAARLASPTKPATTRRRKPGVLNRA